MNANGENFGSLTTGGTRSHRSRGERANDASRIILIALSLTALLAVLSGYAFPARADASDEGAAAHIFQISIAALAPTLLLFLVTADWRRPWRAVRPLGFASVVLMAAFAALFYLEHSR